MLIEKLTRYNVVAWHDYDKNECVATEDECATGHLVNFYEALEASSTDVQQLKAEIAAIVIDMEHDFKKGIFERDYYINRLRQLSAV